MVDTQNKLPKYNTSGQTLIKWLITNEENVLNGR